MSLGGRRRVWNVLLCDGASKTAVPRSPAFRFVTKPRPSTVKNLFVLCSATQLPHVSPLVSAVNHRNQLRVLFVRGDTDPIWLPQMLERANLRAVRNLMVHTDLATPRRVLNAWLNDAAERLIARAMVVNEHLFVTSCEPETFEIPFAGIPALARIPPTQRTHFEIAPDGSYLHWPSPDVHLDLDALRSALDPQWRDKCAAERVMHNKRFGAAVATMRTNNGLRQKDIPGLSQRQVRRIEKGERASVSALKRLAAAHRLSFGDYLNGLAVQSR